MTTVKRLHALLRQHADEFEAAAEQADDQRVTDSNQILAALARGEDPPEDARRRYADEAAGTGASNRST